MTAGLPDAASWRVVGHVGKPHGVKGAFWMHVASNHADWLVSQPAFWVQACDEMVRWNILRSRRQREAILLEVDSVRSRDQAESLRGRALFLPDAACREVLDPDEHLISDLVGLTLVDVDDRRPYGTITAVIPSVGQDLLQVQAPDQSTFLFPFADGLVHDVDLKQGCVRITMPQGLQDLNS